MGLETYHIVIIVVAVVVLVAIMILTLMAKKRRQAKRNLAEIRTVSTIQRVYYEPSAKYTQYPSTQPANENTPAPGWNLTNLDGPSSSVNIRQPSASGVVIQREPVMFTQPGYVPYPTYDPNQVEHQEGYGKSPPYNPAFHHSSSAAQ